MIEIITPDNRPSYHDTLESMYRLRYNVFVDRWGWRIPDLPHGQDCDAFDTERTVYLVERDPTDGEVICCARLNPTTMPHMFSEIFQEHCNLAGVQAGPDIYEASRYAIHPKRISRRELLLVKGRLEWAVTWYALQHSISQLTWFMSQAVYVRNAQLWPTRPLGEPAVFEDDDSTYIPGISSIDHEALVKIAKRYQLTADGPICMESSVGGTTYAFLSDANPYPIRPAA